MIAPMIEGRGHFTKEPIMNRLTSAVVRMNVISASTKAKARVGVARGVGVAKPPSSRWNDAKYEKTWEIV